MILYSSVRAEPGRSCALETPRWHGVRTFVRSSWGSPCFSQPQDLCATWPPPQVKRQRCSYERKPGAQEAGQARATQDWVPGLLTGTQRTPFQIRQLPAFGGWSQVLPQVFLCWPCPSGGPAPQEELWDLTGKGRGGPNPGRGGRSGIHAWLHAHGKAASRGKVMDSVSRFLAQV